MKPPEKPTKWAVNYASHVIWKRAIGRKLRKFRKFRKIKEQRANYYLRVIC